MAHARALRYLNFDLSESGDGVSTLEAMAATAAEQHAAVMAEVQLVLDWAERHFPHTQGPVDDGHDWQHELQVQVQAAPAATPGHSGGAWHSVSLTLSCSERFVAEFLQRFGTSTD